MPDDHRPRISVILLVVVLAALAIGAAASLLAGAATAPGPGAPTYYEINPSGDLVRATFVGVLLIAAGLFVYYRVTSTTLGIPGRFAATVLIAVLLAIGLLVVWETVSGGGGLAGGASGTGNQSSQGTSSNSTNGTLAPPNGTLLPFHVPPWVPFALLVVVVLVVCAVVSYAVLYRSSVRRSTGDGPRVRPPDPEKVRAALAEAFRALDAGASPREVVIQLYGALLERIGPMVGGVERDTPEEIRVQHLERLGIGSGSAESLTRLFEEARYSSHPIGVELADSARAAIRAALADLDRAPLASP